MPSSQSVTFWMRQLQAGDADAAQPLWERYFQQMVQLAHKRLRPLQSAAAGSEDVALSAFHCFWQDVRKGRFPRLDDRGDLWQVLVMLTAHKAVNLIKRERAQKRGGGRVRQVSALPPAGAEPEEADLLSQVVGQEPTPQFALEVAEEYRRLLDLLDDEQLRQLAIWKMEGYSNAEIAARIGRSVVTVERRLRLIRKQWQRESTSEEIV